MADLVVKVSDVVTVSGETHSEEESLTIGSVTRVWKGVTAVGRTTANKVQLLANAAAEAVGTFKTGDFKYFRVTNRSSELVDVNFGNATGNLLMTVRLVAGASYIMSAWSMNAKDSSVTTGDVQEASSTPLYVSAFHYGSSGTANVQWVLALA